MEKKNSDQKIKYLDAVNLYRMMSILTFKLNAVNCIWYFLKYRVDS